MAPDVTQDVVEMVTQGVEKFGKSQDFEVCAFDGGVFTDSLTACSLSPENVAAYQREL
jgi:hypothetical protein